MVGRTSQRTISAISAYSELTETFTCVWFGGWVGYGYVCVYVWVWAVVCNKIKKLMTGRTDLELVVLLVEAAVQEAVVHHAVRPVEGRVVHHQRDEPLRRHRAEGRHGGAERRHPAGLVDVVQEVEDGEPPDGGADADVHHAFLGAWVGLGSVGRRGVCGGSEPASI